MLPRTDHLHQLAVSTSRSPITALLGPRQCGKTTLARQFAATRESTLFDLESEPDVRRLANPELALGGLDGLVVLDEIQRMLLELVRQPVRLSYEFTMVSLLPNNATICVAGGTSRWQESGPKPARAAVSPEESRCALRGGVALVLHPLVEQDPSRSQVRRFSATLTRADSPGSARTEQSEDMRR